MPLVSAGESVSIRQKINMAVPQKVIFENKTDQDVELTQEEDPNGRSPLLKLIIIKAKKEISVSRNRRVNRLPDSG